MIADRWQLTSGDARSLLRGLLPRFYWLEDDGTLRELVDALADEYALLHGGVDTLYDAMFIETCPEALIPYIGLNIGVTGLGPTQGSDVSHRAWVGRILGFRGRKGTLATLGRAATAATRWPVLVTAGASLTSRTESLRHPRPGAGRFVDVFDTAALIAARLPLGGLPRGARITGRPAGGSLPASGVRDAGEGHPSPRSVAVEVWRLQAFPVRGRVPRAVAPAEAGGATGAFILHPLGVDAPLFRAPQTTSDRHAPPGADEIPLAFTEAGLLAALRRPAAGDPPIAIRVSDPAASPPAPTATRTIQTARIAVGNLGWWEPPRAGTGNGDSEGQREGHDEIEVIVDPLRGRLLFPAGAPASVEVDYAYGFSGELGGGPYGPPSNWAPLGPARVLRVSSEAPRDGWVTAGEPSADPRAPFASPTTATRADSFPTLEAALAAAQAADAAAVCLIVVDDSATYTAPPDGWSVAVAAGRTLRIASTAEAAPALQGRLAITAEAASCVQLSGLMFSEPFAYSGDGMLQVEHSTVAPHSAQRLRLDGGIVSVSFSILGRIDLGPGVNLTVTDTIVDGLGGPAITARAASGASPGGSLQLERVTVLGTTEAEVITAEDSLFTGTVTARATDVGIVAYSYVPSGSALPRAIECRPAPEQAGHAVGPRFTSTRYGHPGYGQLAVGGPGELATGARLGTEMGAFNWLHQPGRFTRLLDVLDQMLPAGRVASVAYRS